MSMTDPIADMLTRVRNGLRAEKATVAMPSSTVKVSIAAVLKDEGYITDYKVDASGSKATLEITLKYYQGGPVIDELKRISRPGRRVYRSMQDLPTVNGGLGVAIVSTSQGIMSERAARKVGVGGEVICTVY
ncbi:MAG: 30S ribosomal protein S8 [Gammaproteobacteria bacterium]|nr:30S ribosomal protein S8 [Gammaproteobacteria bacterium]MDH3464388.1 30S ribosomal protein S8 [Gammaproteobacteria bacterium]